MRNRILFGLIFLLAMAGRLSAQTNIDSEPGNNSAPGDSLGLPVNNNATSANNADVDFFKIKTSKIGVLLISVTGTNTKMLTKVQIFRSDGVTLEAFRDAAFSGDDVSMEIQTQYTGVYYIRIQNVNVTTSSSPYTLKVTMDSSDVYEINNSLSSLNSVSALGVSTNESNPTTVKARIRGYYYVNNGGDYRYASLASDQDYYKITTGKNLGVLVMRLNSVPSNLRFRMEMIKDDGTTILGYRDAGFNGDTIRLELLTQYAGIYYVRLRNINGVSNGNGNTSASDYTLSMSIDTTGNEFNDNITQLGSLSGLSVSMSENAPTQVKGKIRGYYYVNNGGNYDFSGLTADQDYYKFNTGKSRGVLVMRLTSVPGNLRFRIEAIKDDGITVLGYRDAAFSGDTLRFELLTQYAGAYYIRLRNVNGVSNVNGNTSAVPYTFTIALDTLGNEFNDLLSVVASSTPVPVSLNETSPSTQRGKLRGYYYTNNGGNYDFSVLTPDQDYYKFTTGKNLGVIVARLTSVPSNLKFRIEFLKDDGITPLGYRDAAVNGDTLRFELLTQYAGVYYLRLRNINGSGNAAGNTSAVPYTLTMALDTFGAEFNDQFGGLTSVTPVNISPNEALPTTLRGKIRGFYYVNNGGNYDHAYLTADQDIYKINTPKKSGVLVTRLSSVPGNLKFRIEVFKDDAVTSLGYRDAVLNGDTLKFELLTQYGGLYFIRIRNVNGVANGAGNTSSTPYTLKIAFEIENDEFNDQISLATPLRANDSVYAKIRGHYRTNFGTGSGSDFASLTTDVDYYKLSSGCYHFAGAILSNVPVNMRMKITAYDTSGTIVLGSKVASVNGERVVLTSANLSKSNIVRYLKVENVNAGNETNTHPSNYLLSTSLKDTIYKPTITPSGPVSVCIGKTITLTSSSSGNNYWSTGEFTKSIVYTVLTNAKITLRNEFTGCYSGVDTVSLIVKYKPTAYFTYTLSSRKVTFNNSSAYGISYSWDFGDGSKSTQANPVHTYTVDGLYLVKLYVTNTCATDSITLPVQVSSAGIKDWPSTFMSLSPNPNNGPFRITLTNPLQENAICQIINSTGQIVFQTDLPAGTNEFSIDKELSNGMYYLMISSPGTLYKATFLRRE